MATKSATTKLYDWGDGNGAIHTVSKEQHAANLDAKKNPKPLPLPPGSYDPGLDASQRAGQRGLGDLISDVATQRSRNLSGLETGLTDAKDSYGRSLTDLLETRKRTGEDYATNIANLERNYANLGTAQGGQQRKANVSLGGAAEQASQKRAANQALEKAPIDTALSRFTADSAQAETRLGEDYTKAKGRLAVPYTYGENDLTTQQERAEREQSWFTGDIAAAKQAQANQLGVSPQIAPPPKVKSASAPVVTLTAAPGLKGVTKKRKGKTVTYTASVKGP